MGGSSERGVKRGGRAWSRDGGDADAVERGGWGAYAGGRSRSEEGGAFRGRVRKYRI